MCDDCGARCRGACVTSLPLALPTRQPLPARCRPSRVIRSATSAPVIPAPTIRTSQAGGRPGIDPQGPLPKRPEAAHVVLADVGCGLGGNLMSPAMACLAVEKYSRFLPLFHLFPIAQIPGDL